VFDVAFAEGGATSIDWRAVAARAGATPRPAAGHGAAGLTVADIDVLKKAIAAQGVVTMIAAPQVVAMNNEPAVMRVGTEVVYFDSAQDGSRQQGSGPAGVLEGLTLTVIAQISGDGIVQLHVAPSYTLRAGVSKSAGGTLPVLRVNEADTLVRVQDGETVVLSGFLTEYEKTKPATGFTALFGAGQSRTTVRSELVILLTPSIVTPGIPATER
jgi:type II secretory pathway component GspD/PulD (secretin)